MTRLLPVNRSRTGPGSDAAPGFTLLELLVAMAIFAVIGAMALGGLDTIVTQDTQARAQMERLTHLQRAMRLIANDLGSLQPRFVRDEQGDPGERFLTTEGAGEYLIRLTRGGWANPAYVPYRGSLQRVQYRLEDETLIREYWPVLDHTLGAKPRSEKLLEGVKDIKFFFYDVSAKRSADVWIPQWPPLGHGDSEDGLRPPAIRMTLELADWGEIERIVEVIQ